MLVIMLIGVSWLFTKIQEMEKQQNYEESVRSGTISMEEYNKMIKEQKKLNKRE